MKFRCLMVIVIGGLFFAAAHAQTGFGPYTQAAQIRHEFEVGGVDGRWNVASMYYSAGQVKRAHEVLIGLSGGADDDRNYLKGWLSYVMGAPAEAVKDLGLCQSISCDRLKLAAFIQLGDIFSAEKLAAEAFAKVKNSKNCLIWLSVVLLNGSGERFDSIVSKESSLLSSLNLAEQQYYTSIGKLRRTLSN